MKKTITILSLIFFAFSPALLVAQESASDRAAIKNTLGFGPRLGYYKAQDADEGNFYGGLQGRIRLGPVLGLEGSVEYRGGQEYGFNDYTARTRFVPVTASMLFFIPLNENVAPYGLAGLGAYYTIIDYSDDAEGLGLEDESDFNMGYHLGFGLELPLGSNAAFNADYRYLFLNPNENDDNLDDASYSGNVFTAGLTFYL